MRKAQQIHFKRNANLENKKHRNAIRRATKKYGCYKSGQNKFLGDYTPIRAPQSVSIYATNKQNTERFSQTIDFINEITKNLAKAPILIDFSETKHITAAAMVTLYASVDSQMDQKAYDIRIRWSRVSYGVNKMLKRSGFYSLVRKKKVAEVNNFTSLQHLPVMSGIGNEYVDDIIDHIASKYRGELDFETEHLYGDAVTETVNNVGRHAYPNNTSTERKWWILCEVILNQLYLAIYDIGIGIPNTVVKHKWYPRTVQKMYPKQYNEALNTPVNESKFIPLLRLPDHDLINLSMLGDVSATRLDKHGQGSKSIKALVNETEEGKLWIFSSKGLLIYESNSKPVNLVALPKTIPGTLIQWNIKLS
ncbi:hypothetical protein TUM4261_32950 [Shewanella sp. c952]|uniref:hypothetical protein n=1 Tax=Shewanella sp. c952 TaxID=2815913 RepID=UPI001BC3A53B|nr:hypothetical protein [Shewanella sp. c952]GIU15637.1 hypothetical protein TUM4261_32950 [Shewanella sp. c952]